MSSTAEKKTNIPMTKENRLGLLRRAREILSVSERWTTADLRKMRNGGYSYCVLGAIEQAAYDLGLQTPSQYQFRGDNNYFTGYNLGIDLSLYDYSKQEYDGKAPFQVNDALGYEETLRMLDGYIDEVQRQEA